MKIKKLILTVLTVACLFPVIMGIAGCGTDIESLTVDTEDMYLVCEIGKAFDTTGLKVLGIQGNKQTVKLSYDKYGISKPDTTSTGEKTITVTYGKITTTFKIQVVKREVAATFTGDLTCGYSAGRYVVYPAEFICFNTLEWELWYRAQEWTNAMNSGVGNKTIATLGDREIRLRTSGRYRLADGVYSMVLALQTAQTRANGSGALEFDFQDPSLPYTETAAGVGDRFGIFYDTLTLAIATE